MQGNTYNDKANFVKIRVNLWLLLNILIDKKNEVTMTGENEQKKSVVRNILEPCPGGGHPPVNSIISHPSKDAHHFPGS